MLKNFNEEFDRLIEWDAAKYKILNRCSTYFTIPGKSAWKNVLTRLYITLGISLCCFTFYINNPSDGKEKEDINSQLPCHHLHLSVNSTEATILRVGVRSSIKEQDRYKENRNLVTSNSSDT